LDNAFHLKHILNIQNNTNYLKIWLEKYH
jgi:hypothetical protein